MTLTWPHINALAAALNAAYPDVDRLSLSPATLAALISDLGGADVPALSDDDANAVKWQWMKLADQSPDEDLLASQAGGRS